MTEKAALTMDGLQPYLGIFCQLALPLILLLIGLIGGRLTENSHIARLNRREADVAGMLVTQLRNPPCAAAQFELPPTLVVAEVVIATDYLKSFLATVKNFFGGRMHGYQRMLDRARREAVCRLLEAAQANGYNAICNVRFESADVGGNALMSKVAMASILASATAYQAEQG